MRLAQLFARAGLHLAVSTVARMRKAGPSPSPDATADVGSSSGAATGSASRTVTARSPHQVWNVDLTVLPLVSGIWVPWIPEALVQCWPFGFWLAAVLDHHSRAVVTTGLFLSQPSAREGLRLLDPARRNTGVSPKYIVSDQGPQFREEYRAWCRQRGIRPGFGGGRAE